MEAHNIINLCSHTVTISRYGKELIIPPSGKVARISRETAEIQKTRIGDFDGIPIAVVQEAEARITNLPAPKEGVAYITSAAVAQAAKRLDVVAPDTGPTALRDENGNIVAVRGLLLYI